MEIKKIKKIEILSSNFNIVWNKKHDGGSFDHSKSRIEIGTKSEKIDPIYTFQVISHEIMELILGTLGARYESERLSNNYLFNFNHQTFETAIQLHTQTIIKFIK